jgi:hypothetical protein
MLPVDAGKSLKSEDLGLSRASVTKTLLSSGGKTLLIVLDMCRNVLNEPPAPAVVAAGEPAAANVGGDGTKGLRRLTRGTEPSLRADQGLLVAFSTSPDQVAFDDGLFSKVLAEEIRDRSRTWPMRSSACRTGLRFAPAVRRPRSPLRLRPAGRRRRASCPAIPAAGRTASTTAPTAPGCGWCRRAWRGRLAFDREGRDKDEPAPRQVAIARPFALGVYEVTVAEWRACVRDGACRDISDWSKENPNPLIPATSISYEDAQSFVAWLSVQSGRPYRLPTEAEWEYASRAGAGTTFPFGDEISPSQANYDHTADYKGSPTAPYRGYPEAVNGYPPTASASTRRRGTSGSGPTAAPTRVPDAQRAGAARSRARPGTARCESLQPAVHKRRDDVGLRVARDLHGRGGGLRPERVTSEPALIADRGIRVKKLIIALAVVLGGRRSRTPRPRRSPSTSRRRRADIICVGTTTLTVPGEGVVYSFSSPAPGGAFTYNLGGSLARDASELHAHGRRRRRGLLPRLPGPVRGPNSAQFLAVREALDLESIQPEGEDRFNIEGDADTIGVTGTYFEADQDTDGGRLEARYEKNFRPFEGQRTRALVNLRSRPSPSTTSPT